MSNSDKRSLSFVRPPKNRFWAMMRRLFGDKYFVRTFWELLSPSIIWGILISIVPLLFNLFTTTAFTILKTGKHGDLYTSINYTYENFTTVNYFAVIFAFAFFPAIGNFAGKKNYTDFRQTMRFAAYLSFSSAAIMFIFEESFAEDFVKNLVFMHGANDYQYALSEILVRPMALMGFFFAWTWIYVPALSSIKNNRPLIYSAVIGFVFFIITDTTFIFADIAPTFNHAMEMKNAQATTGLAWATQVKAATGMGIIYVVYYAIQPIFIYLYLKFFRQIQIISLYLRAPFIGMIQKYHEKHDAKMQFSSEEFSQIDNLYDGKKVTSEQIYLIKNGYYLEKELLFFDRLSVRNDLMKQVLLLSWGNILDKTLFDCFEIIHFVFSTNYGGSFPDESGFKLLNPHDSNLAADHYYKILIANPEMLLVFFYGIWNAFFVVPQYFVARELGMRRREVARKNAWICMNWSYLLGIIFMIIILIFAMFINQYATYPSDSGANWYDISHKGKVIAEVQYAVIWQNTRITMVIWSFVLITYTASLMALAVVLVGASKWIVFSDTLGTIIFTAIAVGLHYSHFDNPIAYYFIPHMDKTFKYVIFMIIMLSGGALNSIHDVTKNRLLVKQWKNFETPDFMPVVLENSKSLEKA